ncbi:hypothetical protein SLA2020_019550 [Shorea laevis]
MGFDKEASSSTHVLQVPSLPREDTPLLRADHLSSQSKTFANVFIAIVGAGVLGLPNTFKKTGWLMGSLILFFVAFLTYPCMMLSVFTRRQLESLHGFSKINSFGDLGFAVCGPIGRAAVDVMIVLTQAGFCVSYLIYISNTLSYVFDSNHLILGLTVDAKDSVFVGLFSFPTGVEFDSKSDPFGSFEFTYRCSRSWSHGSDDGGGCAVFLEELACFEGFWGFLCFLLWSRCSC